MKELSLDELLNQIELMRQILQYYANTENYHPKTPNVMLDGGHNARFVLKQIGDTNEELTKSLINQLKDTIQEYENLEDNTEKIEKLNQIIGKVDNI